MIVRPGPDRSLSDALADWLAAAPARALARAGIRFGTLYERRLDERTPAGPEPGFEHDWLGRKDVDEIAGLTGREPADLLARLDGGERCFGSRRDGRLVAVRWSGTGAVVADHLRIGLRLPAGDAWVFDSWTDPRERGRGLAAAASRAMAERLTEEGTSRLIAMVMPGNRSGRSAVLRSGYRAVGTITTIRVSRSRRVARFRAHKAQPYS